MPDHTLREIDAELDAHRDRLRSACERIVRARDRVGMLCLAVGAAIVLCFLYLSRWSPEVLFLVVPLAFFVVWNTIGIYLRLLDTRGATLRTLATTLESGGSDALGPILDFLTYGRDFANWRREGEAAARAWLAFLLPRIDTTQGPVLSQNRLVDLCKLLDSEDESVCLEIVQVLRYVGEEPALPYLERLANSTDDAYAGDELRGAATECIGHIQRRVDARKARSTLLRPAAGPVEGSDTLLRPAGHSSRTSPDVLVRPADVPSDSA